MEPSIEILTKLDPQCPHVFFVGGCGEFGMNLTAYIFNKQLYIVDCGLNFAPDHEIGIDAHIPNIDSILEYFGGPKAYFITHGHEDHIGALPLFLEKWPAPIYLTRWSELIFENRMLKFRSNFEAEIHLVHPGEQIVCGDIKVDWFAVPHSIPGCCALTLYFGQYKIFHTGDFKMDPAPPLESGPNLEYLASLAPVDLLVADSTNSQSPGFCPSETEVVAPLLDIISRSDQLVVVTSFASNLWRLLSLVKICQQLNRKIYIAGASLLKTLEFATETGLFTPDPKLIINEDQLKSLRRDQVLVIASGSQGEPRSGLKRIIMGEHRAVKLQEGDHVIFSARSIPGNEKSVAHLVSACHQIGVQVTTPKQCPEIHVSGHAYQEDIKLLLAQLKPEHYIPVHGTHTQLIANGKLYEGSYEKVANGSLIKVSREGLSEISQIPLERYFIDSWSNRPMEYKSMRERHKIGDSGLILISSKSNGDHLSCEFIGVALTQKEEEHISSRIKAFFSNNKKNYEDLSSQEDALKLNVRRWAAEQLIKKPTVICKLIRN